MLVYAFTVLYLLSVLYKDVYVHTYVFEPHVREIYVSVSPVVVASLAVFFCLRALEFDKGITYIFTLFP